MTSQSRPQLQPRRAGLPVDEYGVRQVRAQGGSHGGLYGSVIGRAVASGNQIRCMWLGVLGTGCGCSDMRYSV